METNIYNFFKFLKNKAGKMPADGKWFTLKLVYDPDNLTKDDLSVKGDLDLQNRLDLRSLPNNLTVTGRLNLSNTSIKQLPKGLTADSVILQSTEVDRLPEDLQTNKVVVSGPLALNSVPKHLEDLIAIGNKFSSCKTS
jgi:hypothetical protein